MDAAALGVLCDKLEAAHPQLQRLAVSSIFERLGKKGALESEAGKQALERCITSGSGCVVDQSVREVCLLATSAAISLSEAIRILQISLDSTSSSLDVLVAGIGYICRLSIRDQSCFPVHPLLKALKSREEARSAILQQVRLILLQSEQRDRALSFIQPLLASVLLEPSVAAFGRELYASMCLVSAAAPTLAPSVIELLLHYTELRSLNSPQDLEFLSEAFQELIDVLEDFPDTRFSSRVMELLFKFWSESRACFLSSLPFVSLIRRLSMSMKLPHLDAHLSSLSYFLVTAETEQEQLLILALAQSWLESFSGLSVLFLIFPSLHILASPSPPLKGAAMQLLRKIESSVSGLKPSITSSDCATLGGRAFQCFLSLWTGEKFETWIPVEYEAGETFDAAGWLKRLVLEARREVGSGFPVFLGILATAMIFHPVSAVAVQAVSLLASLGLFQPIWGMSLVPVFLFTLKFHLRNSGGQDVVIALLNAFPDICGHPTTLPLSMHFLQPMVECDRNLVIQSTALRLIYKVWMHTDRAYPYLQRYLAQDNFSGVTFRTDLLLSKAVCLREACRHDPDTGVELILSVQACIENKLSILQALGLQSLSSLCSDDAIDFYTAWKVIRNIFLPLPRDPLVAESLCMLLKHGALDAAAYPEDVQVVLTTLWNFSSSESTSLLKTRFAAIQSLCAYEAETLTEFVSPEPKHLSILFLEASSTAKIFAEELVVKFLDYEHRTRQRATSNRVVVTKAGKLLEAVPVTYSESLNLLRESPGAFLLFRKTIREQTAMTKKAAQKALTNESEEFRKQFIHVAEALNVSGDLIMALVSLRSWSWFMPQWLKLEDRLHGDEKALEYVVQTCVKASKEGIPRVAENSMLGLGGLSQSLTHARFETSVVLANHFDSHVTHEEYASAKWSAAISLGIMTTILHPTDWVLKLKGIRSLTKLLRNTEDPFLTGSIGIGLGFAFQSLLLSKSSDNEDALLSDMLQSILHVLLQYSPHSLPGLRSLVEAFSTLNATKREVTGDDFWATTGLVFALGSSAAAFSRAGKTESVKSITAAVLSWIPNSVGDAGNMSLAAGAFLVVSTCIEASDRLELLELGTLEMLLRRFGSFICHVMELSPSKRTSQPWLVHVFRASCLGCGGLLATILQTGRHPLGLETVKGLLNNFLKAYTTLEPQYCFGAMLGFANALGAGITLLRSSGAGPSSEENGSKVTTPLLFSSGCEETVRTMLQQIVNQSHTSEDVRLKSYARWSLGIMHTTWLQASRDAKDDEEKATRWSYQPTILSSLPENSTLRFLCQWLSSIGVSKVDVPCSQAVSVMQCLEKAPRLPLLDWGGLVRRILQHREWFQDDTSNFTHRDVRKQCLLLSLRHGAQVPPLASVLDEMYDFSRLHTLEPSLRSLLLDHLGDLQHVFSSSRIEQLFEDVMQVVLNVKDNDQARECRIHCWKGLEAFFKAEVDKQLLLLAEGFARRLATVSPSRLFDQREQQKDRLEWSAALSCLKHARKDWLLETFPISAEDSQKNAFVRCRLVADKALPSSALKGVRSWLLDRKLSSIMPLLRELAAALRSVVHEEKVEWLLSSIDAVYMSKNPSTALHFVAMLSSVWNPHSYILPANDSALEDLPHSLQTLAAESRWSQSAALLTSKIFRLVEWISSEASDDEGMRLFNAVKKTAISLRKHATAEIVKLIV